MTGPFKLTSIYQYKIDASMPEGVDARTLEKYLNDRGLEGWQVVYASPGIIWFMREGNVNTDQGR